MAETAELRKRVRRLLEEARRTAAERRARTESTAQDAERALRQVVAPAVRSLSGVLRGEGHPFQVSTPAGGVRMEALGHADSFIEVDFDREADPPALRCRVARTRGQRGRIDEKILCEGPAIASLTEDTVLDFLLREITPLVER